MGYRITAQSLPTKNKRVTLLFFLAVVIGLPAEHSFADVPVTEILANVSENYARLHGYQLVGDINTAVVAVGDARSPEGGRATSNFHQSTNSEVDLAAVPPGKVRLQ